MTTLRGALRPVEIVTLHRLAYTDVATIASCPEQRRLLGPVLLCEIRSLKHMVARFLRDLLELEPVHAVGGDEREQKERGESREYHGGRRKGEERVANPNRRAAL